ncbi:uncharacterized protein LOC131933085 [Physella acuta]|uniref:uncharacterized protein LOC131933085 n=1 Tax=Physella acuta TaxID=109671 RepID=UPI0027DDF78C|nr:uncharacterized protein LOC131933085 [Physella acuta]
MEKGEAITALKQRMTVATPLPDEPNFATSDETVVRFLKANDWKYKDAEKALLNTLEYRRQVRPLTTDCQFCHERPGFHSMRQVGFDESGRPVMYSSFAQASIHKNSVDDVMAHLTYLIENAKATMDNGVTTWVFVIDCTWMTFGACNPKLGYTVSNILGSHYPERLGLVICVNINPVFHGVWKALKKLISPGTVSKVKLVRSEAKVRQVFSTYFSEELSDWLLEELALNRKKPLPRGQMEFWNPPQPPVTHDPRGSPAYIRQCIHSFNRDFLKFVPGQKKSHCPHPNIIDALGAEVTAVVLTPQEEAELAQAIDEVKLSGEVADEELSDVDVDDVPDHVTTPKPEEPRDKAHSEGPSEESGKTKSRLKKWILR